MANRKTRVNRHRSGKTSISGAIASLAHNGTGDGSLGSNRLG
jgi:hypothetical protein